MADKNQDELLSFFQIGGIHGRPYVPWNGSGSARVGLWQGYCTHGSVLFPTWHRPYVALYEAGRVVLVVFPNDAHDFEQQLLQRYAIEVAKNYIVNPEHWMKAAQDLRAPYWDWASHSVPPVEVIWLEAITIIKYDNTKGPVNNPLRRYIFHPVDLSFESPYNQWKTTLRHPDSEGPNAMSNVSGLEK